jgi:hypothetical protein
MKPQKTVCGENFSEGQCKEGFEAEDRKIIDTKLKRI